MTSSRLPRRLVLRGLGGLGIALPLLEFTQARAYGQSMPPPLRFLTFFEHGGTLTNHTAGVYGYPGFTDGTSETQNMDGWRPTSKPGEPLALGVIHQPLTDAGLTPDVVVVRGIDNNAAMEQGDYGSGHGISNVTILTAGKGKQPGEADDKSVAYSPSIDQYIGSKWGAPPGGLATVNLLVDAHNYGTPFYKGPQQTASQYSTAQDAFNKLFANVKTGTGPDPAVVRAQLLRRSVLDGVSKGLSQYRNQLTAQDKRSIDAHLEHIRSIEARLQPAPGFVCSKPVVTSDDTIPERATLMVDIALAALRCGVTRVMSLEIGDYHMTWDPTPLPFEVAYDIGHSLHHMARDLGQTGSLNVAHPTWVGPWQQAMVRNRQFRSLMVARLLKGLKDSPEGTGSMLDNSLLLWTSEFSNGSNHLGSDMPMLLAGRAGGALKTGRSLNYNTRAATDDLTTEYASKSTTNNLYISLLNLLGFADTTFGDMQYARTPGPLAGLA